MVFENNDSKCGLISIVVLFVILPERQDVGLKDILQKLSVNMNFITDPSKLPKKFNNQTIILVVLMWHDCRISFFKRVVK